MYYVYVIKKKSRYGEFYIGYSTDLRGRLKEHAVRKNDLVYYEAYKHKKDAYIREKQLKKYKSAWG
ncbi:MAG: GIY-YIG nuclease family protein [Parcubacteria group bacterium]|nr:GIY-YIG nuclease family protein [Parcubacteria group bacterium]